MTGRWIGRVARHSVRAFDGALGFAANVLAVVTTLALPTAALFDLVPAWIAASVVPTIVGFFLLMGAWRVAREDAAQIRSLTVQLLSDQDAAPTSRLTVSRNRMIDVDVGYRGPTKDIDASFDGNSMVNGKVFIESTDD